MLKLKDLSLLESRRELSLLPEGKVLINTINAHSYNTAQKDPLFAEALQKGDALVPDGGMVDLVYEIGIENTEAGIIDYHRDIRKK